MVSLTPEQVKEKESIIKSFGVEITEVEPLVYKVLNPEHEFHTSELMWKLDKCILYTAHSEKYEKVEGGSVILTKLYYIVLDYGNTELKRKYSKIARSEYDDVVVDAYNSDKYTEYSIDTVFGEDEL